MLQKCCYPEPEPVAGTGAGSKLDRLHNTDRSGSVFFRIGSGYFADPDPDSEKNPDPKHCINLRNPLGLRISRSLLYPDLLPVHRFGSGKRMQIRIGLVQT